ncbi:MAG: GHKL domain-containing protein [Lachnospiraceae bacterium]|nr:GHKL domain-containing protein [Lachnospiraceae bacterium]
MLILHIAILYIVYRYMHCFFDAAQVKKATELAAYGLYFVTVWLVSSQYSQPFIYFAANMVFVFLLAQIYPGKQGKKLVAAFLLQGMNILCEVAALYLVYDGGGDSPERYYLMFLLMFVCERIIEKFGIRNMRESTALKHWDLLIFLPIITVAVLFIMLSADIRNRYVGVTVSIGMILLNLIVFYICDELVGAYTRLEESALVERQLESYSNQLDVIMKSEEKVRGLRHDLKHHLSEILMMADAERTSEIKRYVRDMQVYMTYEREYASSGNTDIDSLINLMLDKAKSELKSVKCKVCVPQELDIPSFDWNIILGNLLDNAIFAARNSGDKFLYMKINYQRGILFIHIKNSYNGELVRADDRYITTKNYDRTDRVQIHGMGIKNVKRIVEKYKGTTEIHDENGIFDVRILMYVSVKKEY